MYRRVKCLPALPCKLATVQRSTATKEKGINIPKKVYRCKYHKNVFFLYAVGGPQSTQRSTQYLPEIQSLPFNVTIGGKKNLGRPSPKT